LIRVSEDSGPTGPEHNKKFRSVRASARAPTPGLTSMVPLSWMSWTLVRLDAQDGPRANEGRPQGKKFVLKGLKKFRVILPIAMMQG
jgi:hypothetical protein